LNHLIWDFFSNIVILFLLLCLLLSVLVASAQVERSIEENYIKEKNVFQIKQKMLLTVIRTGWSWLLLWSTTISIVVVVTIITTATAIRKCCCGRGCCWMLRGWGTRSGCYTLRLCWTIVRIWFLPGMESFTHGCVCQRGWGHAGQFVALCGQHGQGGPAQTWVLLQ
jgi:hypothetical protein